MSDDIYEQSAREALNATRNLRMDETKRDAHESGLQARTMSDGEMDQTWRSKGGSVGAPGDVQAREMVENRLAVTARNVITDNGGLDMSDLLAVDLSSSDANARETARSLMRMEQVAGHMVERGAQQVVNNAYMDTHNEASQMMESGAYNPQPSNDGWSVSKKYATLNSGKKIAVFVVEDALSGMTTGKRYRLAPVAEKIARVLNATNNPDDARIKMIESAYTRHVQLMRDRAAAKKSGNTQRVSVIEGKLQEVNARLGLD